MSVTHQDRHPHEGLIDEIGGTVALTSALQQRGFSVKSNSNVSNWRRRGVPWYARNLVASIAGERGIELPPNFLRTEGSRHRHG